MARLDFYLAGALALAAAVQYALSQQPQNRIAARIDESQVTTLRGNVHPLARPEFDLGAAAQDMRLDRMMLLLKSSPGQQAALDALVDAQHDPRSSSYHRWLTPADYAARFGVSTTDLARIKTWLESHSFTVDEIAANNRVVIFSGTAIQVAETLHTEIHRYRVGEATHFANSQAPQIPAALAGVVTGVVSMHDFRRTPSITQRRALAAKPQWNLYGMHYLYPADLAAIYDLNQLYTQGTTGVGAAIAIAGRSNINLSDIESFRASANLKDNNPTVILNGVDPGLIPGDQDESTLDAEWAGAIAPDAAVKLVATSSTAATDGIDLSAQYIVNHALAPVVSVSYGSCEQQMGAAERAFYNSLWQQAASQGMSVLVASGDAGAAGCNAGSDSTGSSAAVNGMCSSTYSTCVGGTEFNEGSNLSQYWAATNSPNQGSALSYIPETVWNESGANAGAWLWASGGGVSQVYTQPAWQHGVSGADPAKGMRAVPDVSLSASSHDGYIIAENGSYWIVSGTSAAAPSFAAIIALVVQSQGGKGQGNANAVLYPLAKSASSPFHLTHSGTNTVPGVAGFTASGQTYNLATGLGSVDAALLVSSWKSAGASPPTLNLAAISGPIVILQGSNNSIQLTAVSGGSFAGSVTLSMAGLPAGVSAVWSSNPVTPLAGTGTATLTLSASPSAVAASATVVITAQGSGLSASRQVTLQVQQRRYPPRPRPAPIIPPRMVQRAV